MANCYGCPYRWHDTDCEYCSAKNDEIIDSKSYSKETCSIYRAYAESQGKSVSSSSGSSSSSSSSSSGGSSAGCGIGCAVVIAIIVIIALLTTGTISFGGKEEKAKQSKKIAAHLSSCKVHQGVLTLKGESRKEKQRSLVAT